MGLFDSIVNTWTATVNAVTTWFVGGETAEGEPVEGAISGGLVGLGEGVWNGFVSLWNTIFYGGNPAPEPTYPPVVPVNPVEAFIYDNSLWLAIISVIILIWLIRRRPKKKKR